MPAVSGSHTAAEPVMPFESAVDAPSSGRIDELVFGRLKHLGIVPARNCSDAVFLRRAYVDVIGTLPTPEEARAFLDDRHPDKRAALVDRLLKRDEFADYWAMKWCDVLRVKSEFPINLWPQAAHAFHRWIRANIAANTPLDLVAHEMLTASGSNFRMPPVNFYRAIQGRQPKDIAKAVALSFLGCRADKWAPARWADLASFFSQIAFKATGEWKEEIVLFDPTKALSGRGGASRFPDGTLAHWSAGTDPRAVFASWLTGKGRYWFARSVSNRVWAWLMGRGIVHEPDDIRPDNPPRDPALLAWLEREVVTSKFDLKHLIRSIVVSRAYQLSSIPRSTRSDAAANWAAYPLRRMEAEVLIDALNQITGTQEAYSSATPEPYTNMPDDQRTVALPDGSITSAFLEMFGRPARDSGMDAERVNQPTPNQELHMLNSSHIQRKLDRGEPIADLIRRSKTAHDVEDGLYLRILSRYPTDVERQTVEKYAKPGSVRTRANALDLAWALVNSAEFLYRH